MTQRKLNFDDSISSSDAGDILIRSTRVGLQEENGRISRTAQENRQMSNLANQQIKISVRKLDSFLQSSSNDETSNSGSRGQPLVSADLRANKKPASSTEIRMPTVRKESQMPRNESPEVRAHGSQAGGSGHKAATPDVLISKYAVGGKEAIRAAMQQRFQNAPVRRQMKVKLLDQSASQVPLIPEQQLGQQPFRVAPQPSQPPVTGDQHAATTAAAFTAAAIAATAPIMKAQSDMEALMSQVATELRRLQEAGSRAQEGRAIERVTQLEEQLNTLTQQRLQHMELIQNQQLQLQNRLLGSALDAVTARAPAPAQPPQPASAPPVMVNPPLTKSNPSVEKLTSDKASIAPCSQLGDQRGRSRSPLETPAPRKLIPKPIRWNSGVQTPKQHTPKASKQSRPEKAGTARVCVCACAPSSVSPPACPPPRSDTPASGRCVWCQAEVGSDCCLALVSGYLHARLHPLPLPPHHCPQLSQTQGSGEKRQTKSHHRA